MNYEKTETNYGRISGEVCSEIQKSHQIEGETFYELKLGVVRLSNAVDTIPVTISERTLMGQQIHQGDFLTLEGEYRSFNKVVNDRSRLILHFFAKSVEFGKSENVNEIFLRGFVCKEPVYRITPFDREICDVLLAVNRANYHKTDYIPCILWGRNARFMASQSVGCQIEVSGRIQSREYKKQYEDGTVENLTAYEVSCQNISIFGNVTNMQKETTLSKDVVNK